MVPVELAEKKMRSPNEWRTLQCGVQQLPEMIEAVVGRNWFGFGQKTAKDV